MSEEKFCAGTLNFHNDGKFYYAVLNLQGASPCILGSLFVPLADHDGVYEKWHSLIMESFSSVSADLIGEKPEYEPYEEESA